MPSRRIPPHLKPCVYANKTFSRPDYEQNRHIARIALVNILVNKFSALESSGRGPCKVRNVLLVRSLRQCRRLKKYTVSFCVFL
jgi:hypothetical protein